MLFQHWVQFFQLLVVPLLRLLLLVVPLLRLLVQPLRLRFNLCQLLLQQLLLQVQPLLLLLLQRQRLWFHLLLPRRQQRRHLDPLLLLLLQPQRLWLHLLPRARPVPSWACWRSQPSRDLQATLLAAQPLQQLLRPWRWRTARLTSLRRLQLQQLQALQGGDHEQVHLWADRMLNLRGFRVSCKLQCQTRDSMVLNGGHPQRESGRK